MFPSHFFSKTSFRDQSRSYLRLHLKILLEFLQVFSLILLLGIPKIFLLVFLKKKNNSEIIQSVLFRDFSKRVFCDFYSITCGVFLQILLEFSCTLSGIHPKSPPENLQKILSRISSWLFHNVPLKIPESLSKIFGTFSYWIYSRFSTSISSDILSRISSETLGYFLRNYLKDYSRTFSGIPPVNAAYVLLLDPDVPKGTFWEIPEGITHF